MGSPILENVLINGHRSFPMDIRWLDGSGIASVKYDPPSPISYNNGMLPSSILPAINGIGVYCR
jgi:hypothetical protein